MGTQIQFRRGTAAEWTAAATVLLSGEFGYETDTGKFKIGDGSTAWASLDYIQVSIADLFADALPEDTAIILDTVLSGDEHWCGKAETGTMGYGATAGELMYLAVADGKWEKAKADAAATSKGKLALCLATTAENSTCLVLLWGKMRSAQFPAAFTVGAPVYIDAANAGKVVVDAPSKVTNTVVRVIGYGNTAEDLYFCPDTSYIEYA